MLESLNENKIIMALAWLNRLAPKTASGLFVSSDKAIDDDYKNGVVYDENPYMVINKTYYDNSGASRHIKYEEIGAKYPVFIDWENKYTRKTTGIEGRISAVVCCLDKSDKHYFNPYIEVKLDNIDDTIIVIENGIWQASEFIHTESNW